MVKLIKIKKGGDYMSQKITKNKSDPSSSQYANKINSKAHNKSPYGEDEPSTHTKYN